MRKRQNAKQEKELDIIKKKHPKYKLTKHLDLARLKVSETFPYKNKFRIYRDVSNSILQSFEDMQLVFQHLPSSYQTRIMEDSRVTKLLEDHMFPASKQKEQN